MTAADRVDSPFLERVKIRNYKSIGLCNVELGPLTVLVGHNGAGKSNFIDALRFVKDGLSDSLGTALQARGGIDEVRRRSTGHPRNFTIELRFRLPDFRRATYGFEITARKKGGFAVKWERLQVLAGSDRLCSSYRRELGEVVEASEERVPAVLEDRLYLVNASGLPSFREAYDALVSMGFYNLNPKVMKDPQVPDAGELLHPDGTNLASVVARLGENRPETMERVREYLSSIVPGIMDVKREALGQYETLRFRQSVKGSKHPWKFQAASMSDGTLRALGALVAVTQPGGGVRPRVGPVRLVGIEEPETALHPAAAGTLMDALREATSHTQILLTTHSGDLLDALELPADGLLAVVSIDGTTRIAPVDSASTEAIREHLYTPGELLRMNQLEPDARDVERQEQLDLFDDAVTA